MTETETLFEQFSPITTEQWEEILQKDLKGADYEKKLVWNTLEGLRIKPYYQEKDLENTPQKAHKPAQFPYTRGTRKDNNWLIREEIHVRNKNEANALALKAIEHGANSIEFVLYDDAVKSLHSFEQLLFKIDLEKIEINFTAFGQNPIFVEYLLADIIKTGFDKNKVKGSITLDPLGFVLLHGRTCSGPISEIFDKLTELTKRINERLPNYNVLVVNAQHIHNAGGHAVQELAYALSMGVEYIHRLTSRQADPQFVIEHMSFVFASGTNYFMEIAKFRAARLLWASIVEKYLPGNTEAAKMKVHARTSEWTTTHYDAHVNMLRTTTQAMAAAIGGVDSLTVLPYNYSGETETSDEFALRIARNQQIILKEEAYFDKVADPAAGSYYIENLTTMLAENAWKLFVEIEEKGGFVKAFSTGFIYDDIQKTAEQRRQNIATRKEVLLGVNQYPNPNDELDAKVDHQLQAENKTFADLGLIGKPVRKFRAAFELEHLRRMVETMPNRPTAFLLTYGNQSMRKARAGFASNFFSAVGVKITDHPGYGTIDEAVSAIEKQKPEMVVLCSADDEYLKIAQEIQHKLKHNTIKIVAGNPTDSEAIKQTGFEHFIHAKSNLLKTTKELLAKMA